jgi:ribonuclease HI
VKDVTIFSDGACEGNPGPGGWAAVLQYGKHRREISGGEPATTNNRMELQAAIEALRALKEPCAVAFHTDSKYLKDGISTWVAGWKRRQWRTSGKKPVKNQDQWQELDEVAAKHKVTWHWVKGHAGHPENERCDQLALAEIEKLKRTLSPELLKASLERFRKNASPTGEPRLL